VLIGGCGDDASTSSPSTSIVTSTSEPASTSTLTSTSRPSTTAPPTTTIPVEQSRVATYFTHAGLLVAGSRDVAKADALRASVAAVVEGPNAAERAAGFSSAIPSGTALRGVALNGRRAEVDVSSAFTTGGGSLSMRMRVAQIVYTVTRLGVADTVRFLVDGQPVESIGGEGFIVTNVTVGEFDDLLPPVVIEFPTPGATVARTFAFRGLANVFEGTVSYELLDARSKLLAKGFATGMMGAWGPFQTMVSYPSDAVGPLVLSVFTVSPKDGARRDESRISLVPA
jgi:hypothetical protein